MRFCGRALHVYSSLLAIFLYFTTPLISFEYPQKIPGYFSQHGQDKFLNEEIFKGKESGVFIEIGAHDGISFSNTYFFEQKLNWTGICVEPILQTFEKLVKNRKCICENSCVSTTSGKKSFLKCSGYITEMYSGILDDYDPRHLTRLDKEIAEYGGGKEIIQVNTLSFHELLEKNNINQVDLLCLDIEGGEENILRSIDFDKVKIQTILVENNFNEDSMRSFLASKGYLYVTRIGKDDVYQLECDSE